MTKKILIVEDYPANILILSTFIEQLGHQCDVAETGELAVEKVCGGREYDLLLMDLNLPKMDGYQACTEIRKYEATNSLKPLPIVGLSADVNDTAREKSRTVGMNGIMLKSMSFDELASTVERFAA